MSSGGEIETRRGSPSVALGELLTGLAREGFQLARKNEGEPSEAVVLSSRNVLTPCSCSESGVSLIASSSNAETDSPGLTGPVLGLNTHFFFSVPSPPSPFSSFLTFLAAGALLELALALPFLDEVASSSSLVEDSGAVRFLGVLAPLGFGSPPAFFLTGLRSSASESVEETAAEDLRFFVAVDLEDLDGLTSSSESVSSTFGARFFVAEEAAEVEAFGLAFTLGLRSTSSSSELRIVTTSVLAIWDVAVSVRASYWSASGQRKLGRFALDVPCRRTKRAVTTKAQPSISTTRCSYSIAARPAVDQTGRASAATHLASSRGLVRCSTRSQINWWSVEGHWMSRCCSELLLVEFWSRRRTRVSELVLRFD